MKLATAALVIAFACSSALATTPSQRALSFEDRVKAQTAIERVYYSHQLGATKKFEDAVPKAVLENRVRQYLEQTAALNVYWKTAVTDEMLQRELERMAQGTRMPERLVELYAALGNDPFLIKECLARATLVDRLTRNFYAFDSTMHVKARGQAELLHRQLVSGELSPSAEHENRTVSELVASEPEAGSAPTEQSSERKLTPDEFQKRRAELPVRPGQVSDVKESRESFTFEVLLSEAPTSVRIASYVVAKVTWDAWWKTARLRAPSAAVAAVATSLGSLTNPKARQSTNGASCTPDDTWDNGTLDDLPDSLSGRTAVWTGSVMIVWGGGGNNFFGSPGTGGRYDPATDSWAPTSTTGAPIGRFDHSAIWTGSVMVVWGGRFRGDRNGNAIASGGRYDPSTDSWTSTSEWNAPPARRSHTAVWTGREMIVWGGAWKEEDGLDTGGRYNPETDRWTPTSTVNAPSERANHTAIWTGSEMIVWGGDGGYGSDLTIGGRYNPATDRWTPTSSTDAPAARTGHTAVWTGSQMVVWGGGTNSGGRYDPAADTWTPTSTAGAPSARSDHDAVWTGSLMVVWGGSAGSTGGRYDPAGDRWTAMSTVGADFDGTAVWTGTLMVVWGATTGGRYDPTSDSWTPISRMGTPETHTGHTAIWTGSVMVAWGGGTNSGARYDPAVDTWTPTSITAAPSQRANHTAVWTGQLMVVWGGDTNTGGRYDPMADSWTPTSTTNAPSARSGHTAVWTGNQMIVWGGYFHEGFDHFLDTGSRYDPAADNWTPTSATESPSVRSGHTAVWTGSEMIVWGGYDDLDRDPALDTGGLYDPAADIWTPTSRTNVPEGRSDHAAVWTGSVMVVWGGWYRLQYSHRGYARADRNDGGRYDPATETWMPTSVTNAPSPRSDHTAVWTGTHMVVWGGNHDNGGSYGVVTSPTADRDCDGLTAADGDCDDTRRSVYPGAPQICDGINDDCNDPAWPAVPQSESNLDGDAFLLCAGDCDDTNASIHPGAAETCNAMDDNCDGVVDDGGDELCNDGDVCTDDSCHGAAGCGFVANSNACDDGNPCNLDWCDWHDGCIHASVLDLCDDGNPCTDDICDVLTGCANVPNHDPCDDYNACTIGDFCGGDSCHSGESLDCHDDNPCTTDFCNPYLGCVFADDSSLCNDHNPCTDDTCDPATGCMFINAGNPCTDGNACTSGDWCNGGVCIPGTPEVCHDNNPCTNDACNPATGCFFPNNTNPCSDTNACTKGDICGGGTCHPGGLGVCNDFNPCTFDSCNPATGCVFANNNIACSDGNACTIGDFCGGGSCHSGGSRECNDDNTCTTDSCNPATGCVFTNNTNACDDHLVCTEGDTCHAGVCRGMTLNCTDRNVCTNDTCDPTNGCVHTNNAAPCNDGNACTRTDACSAAVCVGESPVGCQALDQCHDAGVCDPGTGVCSNPNKANGTVCDDASLCTTGETCQSGSCVPVFSGLNHPAPKSAGYYKKLCEKREHNQLPYQGDQLTDADAMCVGQLTATFARIDDICDVVYKDRHGGRHHGGPGDGPNGKDCDNGENELIATAINLCRARVCEAQNLDAHCQGNGSTTVGQSLADADAILDNAARDKDTCKRATCELREINNGHALELNSLVLALENGKVRLNWSSPVLDDGSGTPSSYEVWRRPMGSNDAFVKLGTTAGLTFLDLTAGTAAWEYDITAVIPGD